MLFNADWANSLTFFTSKILVQIPKATLAENIIIRLRINDSKKTLTDLLMFCSSYDLTVQYSCREIFFSILPTYGEAAKSLRDVIVFKWIHL